MTDLVAVHRYMLWRDAPSDAKLAMSDYDFKESLGRNKTEPQLSYMTLVEMLDGQFSEGFNA